MKRRIIGLTGGIACGKTTVSNYLGNTYKIPVFDADIHARDAVKVGSPLLDNIFDRYGEKIQSLDRSLNRKQLGEIIFNNRGEKRWLENQIHPYVRDCFVSNLEKLEAKIVVLSIPLLFEAKMTDLVTEIWVVSCSREDQIRRLITRDHLSREQAISRIDNQLSITEKIALADVVLDNSAGVDNLYEKIDRAIKTIRPYD